MSPLTRRGLRTRTVKGDDGHEYTAFYESESRARDGAWIAACVTISIGDGS